MKSVGLKRVYALAEKYDKELLATDSRFQKSVHIIHEDGSIFDFNNAFLRKYKDFNGSWIIVFSEHHGIHIFCVSDLSAWEQYSIDEIEDLEKLK